MLQKNRLEQNQKLALTRSMQLSIEILQMDSLALSEHVNQELLENPFLDTADHLTASTSNGLLVRPHHDNTLDTYSPTPSLEDYLLTQIALIPLSAEERRLAEKLVYCLDENGFMSDQFEELAYATGARPGQIQQLIDRLQLLEPTGVFAHDLAECLKLQLIEQGRFNDSTSLLLNHLNLVAEQNLSGICKLCNVETAQAKQMIGDIRSLNARPCSGFHSSKPDTRIPDLLMVRDDKQSFHAELNSDSQPAILLNDGLYSTLQCVNPPGDHISYYRECYNRASWLVLALQKRANTMLAIGNELAKIQRAFLTSGNYRDLSPLQMEAIAARLRLHKSTICRALLGRSIKTDHGIFEARVFFVRKANSNLENTTVDEVLDRLTDIVKSEHIGRVFSDREICQQLADKHLTVGLRTISKYRKILNIPSSYTRRRQIDARFETAKPVNFHL